jgi:hypothetical protein
MTRTTWLLRGAVGGGGVAVWTVRDALPDFDVSWVLVAVTVAVVADAGAVKSPFVSTVPVLADQVTAEL